jgi:hypothetical protein
MKDRIPVSALVVYAVTCAALAWTHRSVPDRWPGGLEPDTRILLVGDSGAERLWTDRTMRRVLARHGRPDVLEKGDRTVRGGSTAADWRTPARLQLITDELRNHPSLEVVQLSLGVGDLLGEASSEGWSPGMPRTVKDARFSTIVADIEAIVDHVLAQDPRLEVVLSAFEALEFDTSVSETQAAGCASPSWHEREAPTPLEINAALAELADRVDRLAANRERVTSVRHPGASRHASGEVEPPPRVERGEPSSGGDCLDLIPERYESVAEDLWEQYYTIRYATPAAEVDPGR